MKFYLFRLKYIMYSTVVAPSTTKQLEIMVKDSLYIIYILYLYTIYEIVLYE